MKLRIYILLTIGILIFQAADGNAQVKGGSFSVTPFAGYSMFAEGAMFEDAGTYGLAVGYSLSENFTIEMSYNRFDTEVVSEGIRAAGEDPDGPGPAAAEEGEIVVPGGADTDAFQYAIEMLFYIYSGDRFAPYAAIGFGMTEYEYPYDSGKKTVRDHNAPVGFGAKYFLTDRIAIRGDLRAVYPVDQNNLRATVGVTFQFGGE